MDAEAARRRPARPLRRAGDEPDRRGWRLPRPIRTRPEHRHRVDRIRRSDALRRSGRDDRVQQKRFVTSLGVTSHWYAEAAEVTDDSPTLVQPAIDCKKAMGFVPVSFELFEDSDIAQQIGGVFADSKAAEEARVFTVGGTASNEPNGIITALVAAGGGDDHRDRHERPRPGRPLRQPGGAPAPGGEPTPAWMMNLSILNGYRQLPAGDRPQLLDRQRHGADAEGARLGDPRELEHGLHAHRRGRRLPRPLSGDFRQYAIVDRVGTTIESSPNCSARTADRADSAASCMHWRVGADVLIADAFRLSNFST